MKRDAAPLSLACTARRRARGLLFAAPSDRALVLLPCNDVHTVGMRRPLDIAFVDAGGTVLEAHRAVGPFRRLRNRRAEAVIERFSTCDDPWYEVGDRVGLTSLTERNPL